MYLFVCCWVLFPLTSAPSPTTNSRASKALSFENYVVIFLFKPKGDFGLVYAACCLRTVVTPGSSHYQNTDKPKVASQPTTERRDLGRGSPTQEPKDMPCHGLCLAYVHISGHDIALFIYISFQGAFPISFLLYLPRSSHFCCYCHSSAIVTSAMSCPWESYIMVFAMYYHTCVNVPECSGPEVAVLTVCTHAPSYVYALSHVFCWSLWLQRRAHCCPL